MSNVFSLIAKKLLAFHEFATIVRTDTEAFLDAYPKARDSGIQRQENMIMEQMATEHVKSRKGKVKTLLLTTADTKKLGDKLRKSNRGVSIKDMEKTIQTLRQQGLNPIPVSENWLGEGFVGLGDFGHTQSARQLENGNFKTFFPLRGLTSRLKTFHWTQGHSLNGVEVLVPCIVVVDEKHDYVTPAGEILVNSSITDQDIEITHKPAPGIESTIIRRKFKSGRVVDGTGLKGITIPCDDLGTIQFDEHELDVNVIAGPNSLKGGLTQMRILAKQFTDWQESKIEETLPEILEGVWTVPNGRKITVKFGLSFVKLTELSDQFDSFSTHRMGTEVVRTLDLQGNKEVVEWLLRKTEYGQDLVYRKMLGEIKSGLQGVLFPRYTKGTKWSLDSLVKNWDLVPFPEIAGDWNGRLVPSKQMVMNASTLLDSGEWIMPGWATAWASVIVSKLSKNYPNWDRLDGALKKALESKKGATRNSIRPKVPCLQGKQVGHAGLQEGEIATTKERLWNDKAMVVRYPLLWNQVAKATIKPAPKMIGPFVIDLQNCKGLIFRNFQDMGWEQSDADGDVCFAYVLPAEVHRMITEFKSGIAHKAYLDYVQGEASAVLKERPVTVHNYEEVMHELLVASKNKSLIGQATMDLWKIADLLYGTVENDELIEILDTAAFYIQDIVVKGIKHELKGGSQGYNLPEFMLTVPEMEKYAEMIVEALDEKLEDTMFRMGLKYSPRQTMCEPMDSWIGIWMAKVFDLNPEKLIMAEIMEFLKETSEDDEYDLAEAM